MTEYTFSTLDLPTLHRHAVGFDRMFEELHRTSANSRTGDHYPPYNIVKVDDSTYRLEVAAAGFGKSELDVTVQDNNLVIKGVSNSGEKNYVHRGIASRDFTLKFALAEDVVVDPVLHAAVLIEDQDAAAVERCRVRPRIVMAVARAAVARFAARACAYAQSALSAVFAVLL